MTPTLTVQGLIDFGPNIEIGTSTADRSKCSYNSVGRTLRLLPTQTLPEAPYIPFMLEGFWYALASG